MSPRHRHTSTLSSHSTSTPGVEHWIRRLRMWRARTSFPHSHQNRNPILWIHDNYAPSHEPASFAQRNAADGFGDQLRNATPRGFEPLRAEPNGFRAHLLIRLDTESLLCQCCVQLFCGLSALPLAALWPNG